MGITENQITRDSFLRGEVISREYSHFSENDCAALEEYLANILRTISLEFLLEIVFTIINELLVNAFKANAKRIFFDKIGKNINDPREYMEGLLDFRNEFGEFKDSMRKSLEKSDYKIQLFIKQEETKLVFWVINNAEMLDQERDRIENRIESSKKIRNLTEAYMENLDTLESSGLGIVLVKLLLKNSGILENNFKVTSENGITKAYFEIPKSVVPINIKEKIRTIIQDKIERIPPFPENISSLLEFIKKSNISIQDVAKKIEKEPALTIEIIKIANSPLYMSRKKFVDLSSAIQLIGLSSLEQILYAAGTKTAFRSMNSKIELIWDHAIRTAFYGQKLLERKKDPNLNKSLIATGGLVHDLGRMALATLDEELILILDKLRVDKQMNHSHFIEEISIGSSHTEIGALLATKWNFPVGLVECILYHHRPWLANAQYRKEVEIIYLADFLANQRRKPINYAVLDPSILESLFFNEQQEIVDFENSLNNSYESYLKEN
jgi:putative nucleotidyltransferase with HDIG domain